MALSRVADLRVLFVGDSFTAGVFDPEGRGWVGRVVAAAFAAGLQLTPYNLGIRRETSEQIAARLLTEARPRLEPGADCRIVLCAGVNDTTLEGGRPRLTPERSLAALARMLADAAAIAVPVFVVGPPPAGEAEQDERVAELSLRMGELAAERGVPFVAVAQALRADGAWTGEAAAGDGAHPAGGGHAALAALVLAGGCLEWLRRPAAQARST